MLLPLAQCRESHPLEPGQPFQLGWVDAFRSYCLRLLPNDFYPGPGMVHKPALPEPHSEALETVKALQGNPR